MRFRSWIEAGLRGVGQIVFCGHPVAGLLVLAAVVALAPWSAAGMVAGVAFGTVVGRIAGGGDTPEWRLGLAGFNPGIVGLIWGGPLARGDATATLLPLALLGCVVLEPIARRALGRLGLPALGAAALLIGWASHWTFRAFLDSLWFHPGALPLGEGSLPLAAGLLAVAIATASFNGLLSTALAASLAAILSAEWYELDGLGPVGLWAFAVAPAALGAFVMVPRETGDALRGAAVASFVAAGTWIAWVSTPLATVLPPLLAPCLIGIWCALALDVRRGSPLVLDPLLWRLAAMLKATSPGRPAVVLTGAGVSTASGIPDYISGAWLNPAVPTSDYAFGAFASSRRCRRNYWTACHRFREAANAARPNAAHAALAALQRAGWISTVITQNVDGLHQAAGSTRVVEIHGNINTVRCLNCDWRGPWPADGAWDGDDVLCPACGALAKPAVIAMGEDLPADAMREAEAAVDNCGLLLVVGSQMAISSALGLLAAARRRGAQVAFITIGPLVSPVLGGELLLERRAELALRALASLAGTARPRPV